LPVKRKHIVRFIVLLSAIISFFFFVIHEPATVAGYASPVDTGIQLSANFGEIRPGHRHMGLDIRTNGRENVEVKAVADGYVSRIGISASGYGNVIYITHNNNRTSVYAHLNEFYSTLGVAIRDQQQKTKQWEQDLVFAKDRFPVTKGMLIGLSGNTGHSEGPHLHFEWRDTRTGASVNPQKELFRLEDGIAPVIEELFVYDATSVCSKGAITTINSPAGNYGKQLIVNASKICFGVSAVDKMNNNQFNLGTYRLTVFDNNVRIFESVKDSISQDHIVSVHNEVDYRHWYRKGVFAEYLFSRDRDSEATINRRKNKQGVVDLGDKKNHHIIIRAVDLGGNATEVAFDIRSGSIAAQAGPTRKVTNLRAGKKAVLRSGNWVFDFMIGSLFDDISFEPTHSRSRYPSSVSETVNLHDPAVPLGDSVKVSLKLDDALRNKAQLVFVLSNDVFYDVIRPVFSGNRAFCEIPVFGHLTLVRDTVRPVVGLAGWRNKGKLPQGNLVNLTISDNLKKVGEFAATIDGVWVPFNRKENRFWYSIPAGFPKGSHKLVVSVSDVAGNLTRNSFL
ncbi:MAG: M23 family metallopeptidase, partial [Chitinophagaceae bacterium]